MSAGVALALSTHPVAPRMAEASRPMMGGRVLVRVEAARDASHTGRRLLDRVEAWASRLTRFDAGSELSRLNAHSGEAVPVGPTLAAVLDWAREAESVTDGAVDVAMLGARLAAEAGLAATPPLAAARRWSLTRAARGSIVHRPAGLRFDLDGVAKGWLADRALALTHGDTCLVDADGDIALRVEAGDDLLLGVTDPRASAATLAVLRLAATADGGRLQLGIATSGTSVHRWAHGGTVAHHLIDPATWRPAATDLVQVTVIADSARLAEAYAKAAVIVGADRAPRFGARPGVHGLLLLTADGEVRATTGMLRWLA